jgi:hypothetical protein
MILTVTIFEITLSYEQIDLNSAKDIIEYVK